MRIASLHIHPVKAMRAVDVSAAQVERKGLAGDRRFLVVDDHGMFLTQRTHPRLATIGANLDGAALILSAAGKSVRITPPDGAARRRVIVWDSAIDAALCDAAAGDFLSPLLGAAASLVYMDEAALRMRESIWTADAVPLSFADAFPVLVATTASLGALNEEIARQGGAPVPMARFRPNIVIECDEPWAEDRWTRLEIGDVAIDVVKPSDRCIVTTTDQTTGARMGKEPLAALARIRRSTDPRINGVLFGTNAVPRRLGTIRTGMEIVAR